MEAFKSYKQVLDHLRELIADALDVNRNHIEIISIETGEKIGFINYSIEYIVKFKMDKEQGTAKWIVSYWNDGSVKENIKVN